LDHEAMLWMCGFFIRDLLPVSRRTEKFGTQFLSLLQISFKEINVL
jgi:hypothetical protein